MPSSDANQGQGSERPPHRRLTMIVVFTTILIDFIGFSILIPVLPIFADRLGATSFQIGLIVSIYAAAQLVFLPVWGWISDRYGRRPVLIVSLLGTAASFIMLALARDIETVYIARVLSGFFAASIGTAQAVVTDLTPPEERAGGMGMLGAAFGAGMIVGPMLGGAFAYAHETAPFIFVTVIASANAVLAIFWLPESRPSTLARPAPSDLARSFIPAPIRLFVMVHDRRMAFYLTLFFIFFAGFAVLEAMVTLYMARRFGADELDAALVFAWIGVFLAVTQAFFVTRLVAWLGESILVAVGVAIMAVGIAAIAEIPAYGWLFVVGPVIAVGNGLAFPAFTSLYSKACRAEEAGELLGQSNAMGVTGRVVGSAVGGWLMSAFGLGAPFLAAGAVLGGGLALFLAVRPLLVRGLETGGDPPGGGGPQT